MSLFVNSSILRVQDICLDELFGLPKPLEIAVNPNQAKQKVECITILWEHTLISFQVKGVQNFSGRLDPMIQHASNLSKPQLKFRRKVDNGDSIPRRLTLRHKYNARVPLGYDLREYGADGATIGMYVSLD